MLAVGSRAGPSASPAFRSCISNYATKTRATRKPETSSTRFLKTPQEPNKLLAKEKKARADSGAIDLSKMRILRESKTPQSPRFIPVSQQPSQTARAARHNLMPHVPVLPDRISSQPVEVKMTGDYKIFLCQSRGQCDEGVDMLLNSIQSAATPYLGFDTESTRLRSGFEVSVIQLASSSTCIIFQVGQIYRSTGDIPPTLRKLLASSKILKTGVNATVDAANLKRVYKLTCNGIVNIDTLASGLGCQNLSLEELASRFGIDVRLNKSWTKKQWSRTHLTPQEIDYAANDAIASYRLFSVLKGKR
ncbi:ribonuclease H-like protein [Basidiobolus meristosporus CBS 931.73]|uniref:3'-5' exonuclease n=1 Tax=Basidiobolus meristosporus CBS 931.73 TaxID=1314790 RepID=A0A1Y1ZC69_9FUNG|nr:ribonuclease H-like protein [Basidiobolus meristosporus CBS 931.73]|eukprot:ORY07881.1 ribonuclease H-like protein [Basidiobolus meristosporus CBS 931.73]